MSDTPYKSIEYITPQPGDYVVAYYDPKKLDLDMCQEYYKELVKIFPEQIGIIALPTSWELVAENKEAMVSDILLVLVNILSREEYAELIRKEFNRISGDDLK